MTRKKYESTAAISGSSTTRISTGPQSSQRNQRLNTSNETRQRITTANSVATHLSTEHSPINNGKLHRPSNRYERQSLLPENQTLVNIRTLANCIIIHSPPKKTDHAWRALHDFMETTERAPNKYSTLWPLSKETNPAARTLDADIPKQ